MSKSLASFQLVMRLPYGDLAHNQDKRKDYNKIFRWVLVQLS